MNTEKQAFTCIGRGHGAPVRPATPQEWHTTRTAAWLKAQCEKIRQMDAAGAADDDIRREKAKLWVWTPHCALFENNHRSADDARKPLRRLMLDFDQKGNTDVIMQRLVNSTNPSPLPVLLIEESVRRGTHVLVQLPEGMTADEAQRLMAEATGFEPDPAVKDVSRCIYMVPDAYQRYVSQDFYECGKEGSGTGTAGEKPSAEKPSAGNPSASQTQTTPLPIKEGQGGGSFAASFRGLPYADIIAAYWQRTGGEPQTGERNVRLYQLAVNLRAICDNNKGLLMQVMPRLGLSEAELQGIVDSACKETPKGISKLMRGVIDELHNAHDTQPATESEARTLTEEQGGGALPRMPKLIQLLTSKTPAEYKAAVAHAVFPALATHLCGVRFTYTDNVEHEATLMNCLMAATGAGKGCIDEPIRRIMADIRRRDEENTRREAEWKKDCQRKGANKDRQVRPEGLVIQEIDPDMTKPALVTRMDEAEGHFVYVKLNELDLFEQLKGQTGKQHFQLMCLAFDPGAEYGQTRVGTQSVTARPQCRFNWNACTTVLKGRRFFGKVLTDGPISRINFCTIPEMEIGADQPVYGRYDSAFDEALKPYIDNLTSARGLIDCPQATRLARRLQAECADFARLSQNEVYWNLSHRACVIAWLKACVLYVANGQKWERAIEDFVRWSLRYDLWCKMQFFGDDIARAANGDEARIGRRGPRNLLELLPAEFTIDDARRVRQQQGLDTAKTMKMVSQWKTRGYILQLTVDSFQKSR